MSIRVIRMFLVVLMIVVAMAGVAFAQRGGHYGIAEVLDGASGLQDVASISDIYDFKTEN